MLPRWIIFKKCLPGGRRLGKKPEMEHPSWSAFGRANAARAVVPNIITAAKTLNGWDNWEYRFWAADVDEGSAILCECRGCGALFGGSPGRCLHLANFGCAKKLTAAYKLLLKDRRCVICNEKTSKEKWGVPLCSEICLEKWKHEESQPPPLTAALQLVGDVK
jgi:hypothetical protein